ncbi:MAG: hypothetical protein QJR07_07005 [Acetobacteraceae bacterium]|nr:hypothetical protein [Acetobacteraceae bacterium]
MLISIKKRFMFIAGMKTASTAIEAQLAPHCEIKLQEPAHIKHMSLTEAEDRFAWLGQVLPGIRLFAFGVIRDPVEYVVSLYNSHRKPAFKGHPAYSGNLTFSEFWRRWPDQPRFAWLFKPQVRRFLGRDGQIGLDYLVDYARLDEEWPGLCARLGLPVAPLKRLNESPDGFEAGDVPAPIAAAIRDRFAEDVVALRDQAGRLLREAA